MAHPGIIVGSILDRLCVQNIVIINKMIPYFSVISNTKSIRFSILHRLAQRLLFIYRPNLSWEDDDQLLRDILIDTNRRSTVKSVAGGRAKIRGLAKATRF